MAAQFAKNNCAITFKGPGYMQIQALQCVRTCSMALVYVLLPNRGLFGVFVSRMRSWGLAGGLAPSLPPPPSILRPPSIAPLAANKSLQWRIQDFPEGAPTKKQWRIQRVAPGARHSLQPKIFSISCSFLENLAKSYVGVALKGWYPLLQGILYPPLKSAIILQLFCQKMYKNERFGPGGGGFPGAPFYPPMMWIHNSLEVLS